VSVARNDGVEIYYERAGEGPPVLLIMGLGMTATGWWRTASVLAEEFTVLSFDNRGVGRSGRPPGPYRCEQMAADAIAVLDEAGFPAAHVYGVSLGGMIAQELALRWPERVRALVLAATTPGGSRAVAPDRATQTFFQRRGEMPAEEAVWASVPYNYAARTRASHGDRIAADIVERLRFPIEREPYLAQLAAALSHDTYERLGGVGAPTLVVHGTEDRMVAPGNARLLAARIPGAQLRLWDDTGHLFFTDEPRADHAIAAFLRRAGAAAKER
jgi:pimeloyl-ACP methyl ester carboxylesterase